MAKEENNVEIRYTQGTNENGEYFQISVYDNVKKSYIGEPTFVNKYVAKDLTDKANIEWKKVQN